MMDLSKAQRSITAKVEALIPVMDQLDEMEIRRRFADILYNQDTHVSDATRKKWFSAMARQRSKLNLMRMITNLYLGGCDLKVS